MFVRLLVILFPIISVVSRADVNELDSTGHLPDELADIEEMAEKADRKFHEASARILRRVHKRIALRKKAPLVNALERVDTNEFDRY